MFQLHALSVDAFAKVRRLMNRIIIGRERSGRHPTKDASFDIQSLADQLYRSRSTTPDRPESGKIYFSENPVLDLLDEGIKQLPLSIRAFNQSLYKTERHEETGQGASADHPIELDAGTDEKVNELFLSAREDLTLTSNLINLYI